MLGEPGCQPLWEQQLVKMQESVQINGAVSLCNSFLVCLSKSLCAIRLHTWLQKWHSAQQQSTLHTVLILVI